MVLKSGVSENGASRSFDVKLDRRRGFSSRMMSSLKLGLARRESNLMVCTRCDHVCVHHRSSFVHLQVKLQPSEAADEAGSSPGRLPCRNSPETRPVSVVLLSSSRLLLAQTPPRGHAHT